MEEREKKRGGRAAASSPSMPERAWEPPLPGSLLHPMEEREKKRGGRAAAFPPSGSSLPSERGLKLGRLAQGGKIGVHHHVLAQIDGLGVLGDFLGVEVQ